MNPWVWLDERDALAIQDMLIARHGGPPGARDQGLLRSALARPKHIQAYEDGGGVARLAAAYTAGVVRNHPFIDGNKRTGFVFGVLFLELNGMIFSATEEAATQAVLDLAAGVSDEAAYAAFLRANTTDGGGGG